MNPFAGMAVAYLSVVVSSVVAGHYGAFEIQEDWMGNFAVIWFAFSFMAAGYFSKSILKRLDEQFDDEEAPK